MGSENDVEIGIAVDASQVEPGAQAATTGIEGIGDAFEALSTQMAAQTKAITDGFAQMAAASAATREEIEKDSEVESAGIMGVVKSVHEGVLSFHEFQIGLQEFAEVYMAVFAVEAITEWARKMGEAGEAIQHTAETMGVSVDETMRLQAAANATGSSMETVERAVIRMDAALVHAKEGSKQQEEAFKELGININTVKDQTDLVNQVFDKLAEKEPGISKNAIATALLGRNITDLAGILNMTKEQWADVDRQVEAYGLRNDDAVGKMSQLGEAFNENKNAMNGLFMVMAQELAPVMEVLVQEINEAVAAFIQSYESGGMAKQMMDLLAFSARVLLTLIIGVAESFSLMAKACMAVGELISSLLIPTIDDICGWLQVAGIALDMFARIAWDAFTLNWNQIGSDWDKGLARIDAQLKATGTDMGEHFAQNFKAGMQAGMAFIQEVPHDLDNLGKIWNPPKPEVEMPHGGSGGDGGFGSKQTKPKDDAVQVWTEQLHAQEVASNDFFNDQTAAELAFWQSKLAATKEGSKDWLEVQSKIFDAQKTLAHQAYDEQIATDKEKIAADKGNWSQQLADWDVYLLDVREKYKADSVEYTNAVKEKTAAERAHLAEVAQMQQKAIEENLKQEVAAQTEAMKLDEQAAALKEKMLQQEVASGDVSHAKAYAEEQAAAAQKYELEVDTQSRINELKVQAIDKEEAIDGLSLKAKQQLENQKLEIERQALSQSAALQAQYQQQMASMAIQNLQQTQQQYHGYVDGIVSAWGNGMKGMVLETGTWRQTVTSMGNAVVSDFFTYIEKIVEKWIVGELTKKAASAAAAAEQKALDATNQAAALTASYSTAVADINNSAARAAAAAFASTAAIPIVGPELAPAAAASADAAALAFLGQAVGLATGTNYVPATGYALLHEGERVIPKADNSRLESALSGGGRGGNQLHVHAIDAKGVQSFFEKNASMISDMMAGKARKGAFA